MRTSYTPSLCSHNPLSRRPNKADGNRFTDAYNMLNTSNLWWVLIYFFIFNEIKHTQQ